MELSFTGAVKAVTDKETQESKREPGKMFFRQSFVVEETNVRYPQSAMFVVRNDNIEKLGIGELKLGEQVTVYYSVRAYESNGRWYNELLAWDIRR